MDFATDARLRKALKGEVKDAIMMIVAQRVSTIMQADQIVVLDEGKVVGQGTHRALLKNCPIYHEIAASQLSEEEMAMESKKAAVSSCIRGVLYFMRPYR